MHLKSRFVPDSGPLLGGCYLLVWLGLWLTVQPFWILPYGLRFGALLLTPTRYWGWILGAELTAATGIHWLQEQGDGWGVFLIGEVSGPLVVAAGLGLLRHLRVHLSLNSPSDVIRLLVAVTLIVTATAVTDAALLTLTHMPVPSARMIQVLGRDLLSHYLGILLMVPLMIMLLRTRVEPSALHSLSMDGMLVMLPAMTILLALSVQDEPLPQFARVLSLAPVLFFAFRHGWRGASLAMIISSLGITLVDQQLGHVPSSAAAYLFLAVAGTGAIMLGSATDALRRSSARVAEQNVYLGAVNRRLDQLAHQLRDAARGNLHAEENQRRHLAAELHDELGQNITAIQTHVKLAQARLQQAGMEDVSSSINTILARMRNALHRLLDDLRPAVLDEFGLFRAIDEGPIRELLSTAGIEYFAELHGDPRLLDDDTRTALYRLAQEAATNTVKHAHAGTFRLRLRIGARQAMKLAMLDLRDDGIGLPQRMPRGGRGLQGMRDRVTSLGGQFRLRTDHPGVHLRILLRSNNPDREIRHRN